MQAGRPAQPSATNSPSSSHPSLRASHRDAPSKLLRHAAARVAPDEGDLGRLNIPAAGERPPRARPWRRGSPGPVPNPAVKPAVAESTAEEVRGRLGSRARGGRLSYARGPPRAGAWEAPDASSVRGLSCVLGAKRAGMDGPAPGASANAPAGMRVRGPFCVCGVRWSWVSDSVAAIALYELRFWSLRC